VPVPEAEPLVEPWRSRYDATSSAGLPAHITIVFPFVPPERVDEEVANDLRRMLGAVPAFDFSLVRTARFPDAGVLYLVPEPREPFVRLIDAVTSRYPEHQPYEGVHAEIIPHLTVVRVRDAGDDPGVLDEVDRAIVDGLPIAARVGELWLMAGDGRWETMERFPVGREATGR
jgi:2'-5' RNA ligase